MGLLDELKKLTKPYDDEDYLEEDLAEPVRAPGRAADATTVAMYLRSVLKGISSMRCVLSFISM